MNKVGNAARQLTLLRSKIKKAGLSIAEGADLPVPGLSVTLQRAAEGLDLTRAREKNAFDYALKTRGNAGADKDKDKESYYHNYKTQAEQLRTENFQLKEEIEKLRRGETTPADVQERVNPAFLERRGRATNTEGASIILVDDIEPGEILPPPPPLKRQRTIDDDDDEGALTIDLEINNNNIAVPRVASALNVLAEVATAARDKLQHEKNPQNGNFSDLKANLEARRQFFQQKRDEVVGESQLEDQQVRQLLQPTLQQQQDIQLQSFNPVVALRPPTTDTRPCNVPRCIDPVCIRSNLQIANQLRLHHLFQQQQQQHQKQQQQQQLQQQQQFRPRFQLPPLQETVAQNDPLTNVQISSVHTLAIEGQTELQLDLQNAGRKPSF